MKPRQPEILVNPRPRINERGRSPGWPAQRVHDRLIGSRPEVVEIGQHSGLQIGNRNILGLGLETGIGAAGCRRGNIARHHALPRERIRHRSGGRIRPPLSKALIVSEQEGLVLFDRPTQRCSELIALERRRVVLVEEVPGVQCAVAQIFKDASVQLVGPGSRDHADLSVRSPATENAVQAPLLTFELGFDVLTLRTRRLSKLRPFSGRSLTCCSLINPEVDASVVFTSGASSLTVTCSALAPTSNVRSITASCPTPRLIPSRTACLKPGMVVVISYGPTGSAGAE